LKSVPPGVSNVLGTPSNRPLSTRQEAEAAGFLILVYGIEVPLSQEVLNNLALVVAKFPPFARHTSSLLELLDQVVRQVLPNGANYNEFKALSFDKQKKLLSVIALVASAGVLRYPATEFGEPSSVQPSQNAPGSDTLN
jgi:hypothetical protein